MRAITWLSPVADFAMTYKLRIREWTLLKWKIENNSLWVNFTHSIEKMHLIPVELTSISSKWILYVYMKLIIQYEGLEWHKKRSLFAYRDTQKNLDTFAATLLKWNNENISTWIISRGMS